MEDLPRMLWCSRVWWKRFLSLFSFVLFSLNRKSLCIGSQISQLKTKNNTCLEKLSLSSIFFQCVSVSVSSETQQDIHWALKHIKPTASSPLNVLTYVCLALSFYITISFTFIIVVKQNKLELIFFSQAILYPLFLHSLATLCISRNPTPSRQAVS